MMPSSLCPTARDISGGAMEDGIIAEVGMILAIAHVILRPLTKLGPSVVEDAAGFLRDFAGVILWQFVVLLCILQGRLPGTVLHVLPECRLSGLFVGVHTFK